MILKTEFGAIETYFGQEKREKNARTFTRGEPLTSDGLEEGLLLAVTGAVGHGY